MDERFGDSGLEAFESGPKPAVPREIRRSFLLWLVAIGAGAYETVLAVIDALSGETGPGAGQLVVGVGVRLLVFGLAAYVASRMRLGNNWARITLAVVLGVLGTLSLAAGPISWLAGGHSVAAFLAAARVAMAYALPVDLVPALGAALYIATAVVLLMIVNVYYARSGLWRMLWGKPPHSSARPGETAIAPHRVRDAHGPGR